MLRNLLNKLAKKLVAATDKPVKRVSVMESLEHVPSNSVPVKVSASYKADYAKEAWKDVPKEEKDRMLDEIQAELFSKGYKEIPSILSQYRPEMVQQFVMLQLINLGQYDPEHDNLEEKTIQELISMAMQNNQLQYEQRMIEQNKAGVTPNQVKILTQYGISDMPKDKFAASKLIDKVLKEHGVDSSKPYDNKVTNNQVATIKKLSEKIGVEPVVVSTKKEASAKIGELINTMNKLGLEDKATDAQVTYAKRVLHNLGKRVTKKKEEEFVNMSKSDMSKCINELNAQYNTLHPEATEGQVSYIIQLFDSMNMPYAATDVCSLTKVQATKKIDELTRVLLYKLTRKTNPSMTKENITNLTSKSVRDMIKQIREENSTRDYTVDAETKDTVVDTTF